MIVSSFSSRSLYIHCLHASWSRRSLPLNSYYDPITNMNANDSLELTANRAKDSDGDLDRKTDFVEELSLQSNHSGHKPYGNMLVLLETDRILITLGPDCKSFLPRSLLPGHIRQLCRGRLLSGHPRQCRLREHLHQDSEPAIRQCPADFLSAGRGF